MGLNLRWNWQCLQRSDSHFLSHRNQAKKQQTKKHGTREFVLKAPRKSFATRLFGADQVKGAA